MPIESITDTPLAGLAALEGGAAFGLVAVVGLLYCFLGYPIFRLLLAVTGFGLAGSTATVLAAWVSQMDPWAMGICGVLGGLCGALAMYFLYRSGVFILGVLGFGAGAYHFLAERPETWALWAIGGIALAGGLLALFLEKPVMRLATAGIGAAILVQGTLVFFLTEQFAAWTDADDTRRMATIGLAGAWLLLTLIGFSTQHALRRRAAP